MNESNSIQDSDFMVRQAGPVGQPAGQSGQTGKETTMIKYLTYVSDVTVLLPNSAQARDWVERCDAEWHREYDDPEDGVHGWDTVWCALPETPLERLPDGVADDEVACYEDGEWWNYNTGRRIVEWQACVHADLDGAEGCGDEDAADTEE